MLNSGSDRLSAETFGTGVERALARAAADAIGKTAKSLVAAEETQEHLTRVLREMFDSAILPDDDALSVAEALMVAVDRALLPLDDRSLTPGAQSALADLGVDLQTARKELARQLVRAIQFEAIESKDLAPLAAQLNADLQSGQIDVLWRAMGDWSEHSGRDLPHAAGRVGEQPALSTLFGGGNDETSGVHDCAELAAELDRRSAIAAEDAAIVSRISSEFVTLDSLYVPRTTIETACSTLAAAKTLVLVGEAGNGKTSLLWAIYQQLLFAGRIVVFLSAAQFDAMPYDGTGDLGRLGNRLVSRLRCPTVGSGHPVVLLDTADALLHRDADRERLLLLVDAVGEAGAATVIACRPLESRLLPLAVPRLDLPGYSPDELVAALSAHQAVFGQRPMPQEAADRLVSAVRWESPMLPILQRPLTLRMLFELYAPEDIPSEINTFGLFLQFWTNRVEADVRPGARLPVDSENLGSAVLAAAVEMLARGVPSVPSAIAGTHPGLAAGTANTLRSRGVFRQAQNFVEFFHQSFFEHSAGRAIAVTGGPTGMDALLERAEARPTDGFIWPVVEQALLYTHELIGLERYLARLVSWCRTGSELSFNAVIGVWANSIRPLPELAQALAASVSANTAEARVRALVDLLPTVPSDRSSECVVVADAVWRTQKSTLRRLLLDVLPALAQRSTAWALDFLSDPQIISELCSEKLVDKLAPVATALVRMAEHDADCGRSIRAAEKIVGGFDEHPVGGFFAALCRELSSSDTATTRPRAVNRWVEFLSNSTAGLSPHDIAPVLSVVATIQQLDAVALLEKTAQAQASIAQAWLQVTCRRVAESGKADSQFVDEVLALPTQTLQGAVGEFANLIGCDPALVSRLWHVLVDGVGSGDRWRLRTLSRVLDLVPTEYLSLALENSTVSLPDECWRDEAVLGRLLVAAALTDFAQAVRILESEVVYGSEQQRNRLAAALEEHANRHEYAGRILVDVAINLGQFERLARVLAILPAEDAAAVEIRETLLASLHELESKAPGRALKIRRTLLEQGVSIEAHLLSPLAQLDHALSPTLRQHLFFILHHRALDNLDDPAAVISAASETCMKDGASTEARLAGLRAATHLRSANEGWVESRSLLLQGDIEGRHLAAIRPILIRLANEDQTVAISALRELGNMFPRLSGRSRKDAASSLYEPLLQVFRTASQSEATRLFVSVAACDDRLGAVAARALSDALGPRFLAVSEELAENGAVRSTAARLLLKLREPLARQLGSSEWPEIRSIVAV